MRTTVLSAAVFGTFFFAATAGAQWVKTTGPWSGELFSLVSGSGGLVAGTAGVVSFSADNGATWTDRFVCENGDTASGFNALAVSGASIFAGCNGDGVFVSSNNGASWSSFNTGLTDKNIFGLLVSGTRLYAATGSGVFVTQNTTANWSGGLTGLPVRRFNCFTVSGSNVFAGSFQRGIFVSSSNGLTWTAVNTGLSSLNSQSIWSMASAGGKVYAGTLDGVYVSTDQGGQWTAMNDGLTNTIVGALAVSDTMIFAGTDAGVFACNRGGTTWRYIHDSRMDSVV
jgi:ligand-binding sensor domain-containing protein